MMSASLRVLLVPLNVRRPKGRGCWVGRRFVRLGLQLIVRAWHAEACHCQVVAATSVRILTSHQSRVACRRECTRRSGRHDGSRQPLLLLRLVLLGLGNDQVHWLRASHVGSGGVGFGAWPCPGGCCWRSGARHCLLLRLRGRGHGNLLAPWACEGHGLAAQAAAYGRGR